MIHIPLIGWRLSFTCRGITVYTRISFLHIRYRLIPLIFISVFIGIIPGYIVHDLAVRISTDLLITILVVVTGWFIAAVSIRRQSRRQHTINTLQEQSFSKTSSELAAKVVDRFPPGTPISKSDAETLTRASLTSSHPCNDTYRSLMYLLNYYEFISIGIKNHDFDVQVMHNYYHTTICKICEKSRLYICHRQSENPRLYKNLVNLYKAWKPSDTFPD